MKFENRFAVVTGGAGGIGGALARRFSELGVGVAVCDLSLEKSEKTAESIRRSGGRAKGFRMDVTDTESVRSAAREILAEFGRIDILVNNAGVWVHPDGKAVSLCETPEEFWKTILDVNLGGTFRVTQAFLPEMRKNRYGRIVNLGSISGEVGLPGYCDYSAAKGGVIAMTKALAMEEAKNGITVNCVSPGMIAGGGAASAPTDGTWIGRTGTPEEVAGLIAFLSADDSGFITGADCVIDGGRILGPRFNNFGGK